MRCPECGKEFDYLEARMSEDWRRVIGLLPSFGDQGRLVFEYIEKFGVNPLRLKSSKILRLLKEMEHLFKSEGYTFSGKVYRITRSGIVRALTLVNNKAFDRPLENHNYLKKVMVSISKEEQKERSIRDEKALREKEASLMSEAREGQLGRVSLQDCLRNLKEKAAVK